MVQRRRRGLASRPAVQNAADQGQVKRAAQTDKDRKDRLRDALRDVMATPAGRIVLWELMGILNVWESCYDQSGQRMAWKVGRQDAGHELFALLVETDEDLYMLLEREGRAYKRNEDAETDAAHTARVTSETEGED